MAEPGSEIVPVTIEDELRQSYLDYAMSVIIGRALPDARDGLKPVHRRVLFAMNELNLASNRPYMKSARVVGEVMGKYHPHGDSAIYDTIVRMVQDFSLRYPLVDGQGNFGSIDPDPPAAMRYTEVRMAKLTAELLADLDRETVDFSPNYDESLQMPDVLPTRVPNLLVNGSTGIAVGMATNIPPHNLREIVTACLALLDDPTLGVDDLMQHVTGPDFPTGGIISGRAGIVQAYRTGRGRIYVRARAEVNVDEKNGRDVIVIREIPYQVTKGKLIERIAELVKEKKIEGIAELRDESDKDGMRIVIEMKRGESGDICLNNLYAQTSLQTVYGINCVALVDGQPKVLNLREMIEAFLSHRREVVARRTVFLLRKARERGHLLEGQAVALSNIDEVIETIKNSATPADARRALVARSWLSENVQQLLERAGPDACRPEDLGPEFGFRDGRYHLSEAQAQAILDMRLNRLTGIQQSELLEDYGKVLAEIAEYLEILGSNERLRQVVREELTEVLETYGDDRRTEIVANHADLSDEDLIEPEDMVVTVSHAGYAKAQPLSVYQAQRRGGKGKMALSVREEDFVAQLLTANSHDTLLCFSNLGKVYWLRVFQIPQGGRGSRGRPLVNLLSLSDGERITTILAIRGYEPDKYVIMVTAFGTVKKTDLEQFSRPRSAGLIALDLDEGDTLVSAAITNGESDILLVASNGKAARFDERQMRPLGRTARGVRGMMLDDGDRVLSLITPAPGGYVLTASERGYGKRTAVHEFPRKGRGTQGVIAQEGSERNGPLIAAVQVFSGDELMLISDQGTLVRTRADEVRLVARNTQGVRLINLREGEQLVGLARIVDSEDDA
jgi:DNA gyrase subunit A